LAVTYATKRGETIVNKDGEAIQPSDWVVNIDEGRLLSDIEK